MTKVDAEKALGGFLGILCLKLYVSLNMGILIDDAGSRILEGVEFQA